MEYIRLKRSRIRWFFRRLLRRVSIFHGFNVGENIDLYRNKKYLEISNCVIDANRGGRITVK